MPKVVVVSNRTAVELRRSGSAFVTRPTVGGLAAAVEPVLRAQGGVWIGWLGRTGREDRGDQALTDFVPDANHGYSFREILLSDTEVRHYYHGFSNESLWPLCHTFLERCQFDARDWEIYHKVNRRFAAAAVQAAGDGDLIWVHDYHLALVPGIIRDLGANQHLAFCWHIPFPPLEIFEALPWGRQILQGLLGSDLIAFHVPSYLHNFLRSAQELLGAEVDHRTGEIIWQGRTVRVKALPIGIEDQQFRALARDAKVQQRARALRASLAVPRVILGVGRLDYTKGILERLQAMEMLLESDPDLIGQLALVEVVVPSRENVRSYQELRRQVEEAVGRINGRFSTEGYVPVHYRFRALDRAELVAHYLAADVAAVTPLRDGLNLIAKEYVASRIDGSGVLVLSRLAGVAQELDEALLVNPYDRVDLARSMRLAAEMPVAEQERRMVDLQGRVTQHNLVWWWRETTRLLYELALNAPVPHADPHSDRKADPNADPMASLTVG